MLIGVAVNDKKKHDPENKSKRARPGKPAIYLEQFKDIEEKTLIDGCKPRNNRKITKLYQ